MHNFPRPLSQCFIFLRVQEFPLVSTSNLLGFSFIYFFCCHSNGPGSILSVTSSGHLAASVRGLPVSLLQAKKVNLSFLPQNQIRTLAKYQPCLRRDSSTRTFSEVCFVYLLEDQYKMILTLLFALGKRIIWRIAM